MTSEFYFLLLKSFLLILEPAAVQQYALQTANKPRKSLYSVSFHALKMANGNCVHTIQRAKITFNLSVMVAKCLEWKRTFRKFECKKYRSMMALWKDMNKEKYIFPCDR